MFKSIENAGGIYNPVNIGRVIGNIFSVVYFREIGGLDMLLEVGPEQRIEIILEIFMHHLLESLLVVPM